MNEHATALSIPATLILLSIGACSTMSKRNWTPQIQDSIADYTETMICVTPVYRVAPWQCRPPAPSGARMSQTPPNSPHAMKLYHLYVSDTDAYNSTVSGVNSAPIGLTLVKESHLVALPPPESETRAIVEGEVAFVPGAISELFMMSKVGDADTPNTDQGWVYSVANPAGQVQVSGLIESCMKCHEETPHDRLFGLAPATTVYFQEP